MLPSVDYRRTWIPKPDKVTEGLDVAVDFVLGVVRRSGRVTRSLEARSGLIAARADELTHLADGRLKAQLEAQRVIFRRYPAPPEEDVDEALALLVEAADRCVGLRPYPVQIMAALALHQGRLAEMATGEGKSLTAALAGVLAGWTERPCHVLTTNDYLAERDADEFSGFYGYCGVSVGSVTAGMEPPLRREMYARGVVYTTSKELLADFLRDRIYLGGLNHPQRRLLREILEPYRRIGDGIVLRGIDTAIVDEADSVLIDEAVTPLIISTQQENKWLAEAALAANRLAGRFSDSDYDVDRKYREITFTADGEDMLERLGPELPELWRGSSRREEILRQAIIAREFYKKDQHYVVEDGKIVIVDEFTGRLMHNRSWGNGLHQAVEAKEGLALTNPTETLARLSFQRFFRLFSRISGMTGTAREASSEFWHIYQLPFISVPTNRPLVREVWRPRYFTTSDARWQAVLEEVQAVHASGRPVLVGTRSVISSDRIAGLLRKAGLSYQLLNATNHADEALIVQDAGQSARITIATNMAGRGTDIKLSPQVQQSGGLHVIVCERNDSGRIDRQLIGRCARQGDPGSSRMYASLEDDLVDRFGAKWLLRLCREAIARDPDCASQRTVWLFDQLFAQAQGMAQTIAARQRRSVLRTDTWLDEALIFAGRDGVH